MKKIFLGFIIAFTVVIISLQYIGVTSANAGTPVPQATPTIISEATMQAEIDLLKTEVAKLQKETPQKDYWGIFTGIIALIFTAISLFFQRKHNKLSVKPIAILSVADYEDKLAVYLQNKGTGPLIIENLSFYDQNGKMEKSLINFFNLDLKNIVWSTFISDFDGWVLLPSETKTLLMLEGDVSNNVFISSREKVRYILKNIKVELLYQNIYGDEVSKNTQILFYFTR